MDLQDIATSPLAILSTVLVAVAARTLFGYLRSGVKGALERPAGSAVEAGTVTLRAILTGAPLGTSLIDDARPRGAAIDRGTPPPRRHEASSRPEQRSQKRFRTCFLGTLHRTVGADADNLCDFIDLSASGARIRPVDPIPAKDHIALGLRHFGVLSARIIWRRDDEIGLQFDKDPLETVTVMRGLLPSGPAGR